MLAVAKITISVTRLGVTDITIEAPQEIPDVAGNVTDVNEDSTDDYEGDYSDDDFSDNDEGFLYDNLD